MSAFVISIGNTSIRFGYGRTGKLSIEKRAALFLSDYSIVDVDALKNFILENFGETDFNKFDKIIMASVSPVLSEPVAAAVLEIFGKSPIRIEKNLGALNTEKYMGLLGDDRIAVCARALFEYPPPLLVVDFGTATTINVVNERGEFLGGAICVGLQTGLNALAAHTAQLPKIRVNKKAPLIGANTKDGLLTGALLGQACLADGYAQRTEKELGRLTKIITGGYAETVMPYLQNSYEYKPDLLLDGLFMLVG